MSLFTSSQFASAAASGQDWREAAKTVLEKLNETKTREDCFNFGFLFVSDLLADDAESILNLFKSVLNIDSWVGGIGIGICSNAQSYIDMPAISAMIGHFDEDDFQIFSPAYIEAENPHSGLQPWLEAHNPMLVFVTGDPMSDEDPALALQNLDALCGGFMIGGLTSSRHTHVQFANGYHQGGLCGVAFSESIPVASTLAQGCSVIGTAHVITKCEGHDIIELDGKPTVEVFEDDLRSMVIKKIDVDPNTILVDEKTLENPNALPEEFHSLIKGEVHAALAIHNSDQNDYLVRNIIGIDGESGIMTIAQHVSKGDRLQFVHRDHETVSRDLSTSLLNLRKRVQDQTGTFEPKGALYISCVARAFHEFEGEHESEMQLIRDIIGDVPLTGFYAGGEISKARLYGYTGILTLFL